MGLHSDLEALGAALLVRRTKFLYAAVALLMFGILGTIVQVSEASNDVGVVAPALADACKDYNFYNGHIEACSTAAQITAQPTTPPAAPAGTTTVIAEMTPLTNPVNR
jgi:hypothetical protein